MHSIIPYVIDNKREASSHLLSMIPSGNAGSNLVEILCVPPCIMHDNVVRVQNVYSVFQHVSISHVYEDLKVRYIHFLYKTSKYRINAANLFIQLQLYVESGTLLATISL